MFMKIHSTSSTLPFTIDEWRNALRTLINTWTLCIILGWLKKKKRKHCVGRKTKNVSKKKKKKFLLENRKKKKNCVATKKKKVFVERRKKKRNFLVEKRIKKYIAKNTLIGIWKKIYRCYWNVFFYTYLSVTLMHGITLMLLSKL